MKAKQIINAVQAVTGKWAKQRRAEERHAAAEANRYDAMTRERRVTIKEVAYDEMPAAYAKASAGGTLPALARQIMYAARPAILARTGLSQLKDEYFTQQLLPNFMAECPELTANWNVVFDARGNFVEPHTDKRVPLGTLNVRDYLAEIRSHAVELPDFDIWERHHPTIGPKDRFGAVLFVEKEGFNPLFEAVQLAERHDLAIMSTKGMSVTASRELVEYVCGLGVPLLVLHDFDKSGFSIVGTLRRSTRRYQFRHGHASRVIDLGLRLEDVDGLETEDVYFRNRRQGGGQPGRERRGTRRDRVPARKTGRAECLRLGRADRLARTQAEGARDQEGDPCREHTGRRLPAHAQAGLGPGPDQSCPGRAWGRSAGGATRPQSPDRARPDVRPDDRLGCGPAPDHREGVTTVCRPSPFSAAR